MVLALSHSLMASGQPNAAFVPDKTGGCPPLIVHFVNRTTGASGNAVYRWDLGNGNSSALDSAQAVYTDPGIYTVSLTVRDGGRMTTATGTITVYQSPIVGFSTGASSVCLPSPVTFNSSSTPGSGAISTWLWDFGDGTTQRSTQAGGTVSHVYQAPGSESVSLTVTNSFGCTGTAIQNGLVSLLPPVNASFSVDKKVLCLATDPVQFTNTSTGAGTLSYLWDFGDGNSSTQPNPSYSFAARGSYTIKLTATSSDGCSATDTQSNFLNVANYQAAFNAPAACLNAPDSFTDKSYPVPDSRVWKVDGVNVGTGAAPQYYSFGSPGVHTVSLTDQFGACPQSIAKQVTVYALPVTTFDTAVVRNCTNYTITLADHTPGAVAWAWIYNYDPSILYPSIDTNGPSITRPFAYFQNYNVRLAVTDGNGCSDTVIRLLNYLIPTVIHIEETDNQNEAVCSGPVTKSYTIQHPELLVSWVWNFGDGTTSTELSPTHTFSGVGEYITSLSYVDKNGCSNTSGNQEYTLISAPMTLDFSVADTVICANTLFLMNSPSLTAANPLFVEWVYGDGTPSAYYQSHIYTTPGVYTVSLYADNGGCAASVIKTNYITVVAPAGAYIGHTNTCDGDRMDVTFNFTPGNAPSLLWDWGDGSTQTTTGSVTQLIHAYPASGWYTMNLTGGNATCSVQNTDYIPVFSRQSPLLTADQTAICPDGTLSVDLSNYQQNTWDGYYTHNFNLQFQYADGTSFSGNANTPYYAYTSEWIGTLSPFQPGENGLRAITNSTYFGCNDTSNIVPLAIRGISSGYEIISDDQCYLSPVILQDTSRVSAGNSIVSWLWDFGDGTTSTLNGTVSHNYTQPGNYPVKLTVQDGTGCSSSSSVASSLVTVNGPVASMTPSATTVLLNTTILFTNSSNVLGTTGTGWNWDFGDGSPVSTDLSPSHAYTQPGIYTVTLTATGGAGTCVSVATATINVRGLIAAFSKTSAYASLGGCPPLLVQFTNASLGYSSLSWDFGDGITVDNLTNPSHVYTKPGDYAITLTATGAGGLTEQWIDSVKVIQPSATLSAASAAICAGQSGQLKASADSASSYTWDFGDGSVGSTGDSSVTHVYASGGTYEVKLVVTDPAGCSVAAADGLSLRVHAPPALKLSPQQPVVCLNASVQLTASGASAYSWSPATGLDQPNSASPVASPTVSTKYIVTATDDIGCMNEDSVAITVVQPFVLTAGPDSTAICPGKSVAFQAGGAASYSWIGDVNGLSGTQTADPVARALVSTVYTVTGTDAHACFTDTATLIVTVLPAPTVSAGPDREVLSGDPVSLDAIGSPDIVKWQWTPALFLSCTECAQPVSTPERNQQYIVTVKNADGCTASDTVAVKILCDQARVRIPDAFTPNGDGHNDRFVILGIAEAEHLVIFDRWGTRVFERDHFLTSDLSACWDGTHHEQPAPTGVYAYFVGFTCPGGGSFSKKGTVVLVR